jgi:hypothetical protein
MARNSEPGAVSGVELRKSDGDKSLRAGAIPRAYSRAASRVAPTIGAALLVWLVFFLVCFGLGYATLNRYDPRATANTDSIEYYRLVVGSPADAEGHWRYRVLVPYLAKPVYWLARGHVGSWDPVLLGLLVANAILVAFAATLLLYLGLRTLGQPTLAALGATLYLLNFVIPNEQLAGYVDSAEAAFLLAVTWALLYQRWWILPILVVPGALGKETAVLLGGSFASVWWLSARWRSSRHWRSLGWVVAMALAGIITVCTFQSFVSGDLVMPWMIAAAERVDGG